MIRTEQVMAQIIWTIGHSNRDGAAFVELLTTHGIELVADVRRFPGSRRWPQFNADALTEALSRAGLGYRHFAELGGRRSRPPGRSPNTAWRVESFNAYADHMASPEFAAGYAALVDEAARRRTAVMCSEAVPWRCHRRLIADALIVGGWTVQDILGPGPARPHGLTEFARVCDGRITYPGETLFPEE